MYLDDLSYAEISAALGIEVELAQARAGSKSNIPGCEMELEDLKAAWLREGQVSLQCRAQDNHDRYQTKAMKMTASLTVV